MGYQIQPNAPQFKVGNETYALGCFLWGGGPVGDRWMIGIFRLDPAQGWLVTGANYYPPSVLDDFKAKGGRVAYQTWIKQLFNNWFKDQFPAEPPSTGEPKDEAEARAMLTAFVNSLTVTVTNGVPSV